MSTMIIIRYKYVLIDPMPREFDLIFLLGSQMLHLNISSRKNASAFRGNIKLATVPATVQYRG